MQAMPLMNSEPWTVRAVCRGRWSQWDSDRGAARGPYLEVMEACSYCPVLADCRRYTLKVQPDGGVWAGELIPARTQGNSRAVVFRRIALALGTEYRRATRRPITHGTASGYDAHIRRREPACPACKAAHAARKKAYNQAKRAHA